MKTEVSRYRRSLVRGRFALIGLACYLLSVAQVCVSVRVPIVSASAQYVVAKDINSLAVVCGIADSTVTPFTTRSMLECTQLCRKAATRNQTTCLGANYFTNNKSCEIFTKLPNFRIATGCTFYGVSNWSIVLVKW